MNALLSKCFSKGKKSLEITASVYYLQNLHRNSTWSPQAGVKQVSSVSFQKNVVSCICEQSFCIFSTGVQLYTATTAVGLFNTTVIVSRLYADRYWYLLHLITFERLWQAWIHHSDSDNKYNYPLDKSFVVTIPYNLLNSSD